MQHSAHCRHCAGSARRVRTARVSAALVSTHSPRLHKRHHSLPLLTALLRVGAPQYSRRKDWRALLCCQLEMEERRREDMLMAKLTRQSNEERRIVAKLAEVGTRSAPRRSAAPNVAVVACDTPRQQAQRGRAHRLRDGTAHGEHCRVPRTGRARGRRARSGDVQLQRAASCRVLLQGCCTVLQRWCTVVAKMACGIY